MPRENGVLRDNSETRGRLRKAPRSQDQNEACNGATVVADLTGRG